MAPTLAEYEVAARHEAAVRAYAKGWLRKVTQQYENGLMTTMEYAQQVTRIAAQAEAWVGPQS